VIPEKDMVRHLLRVAAIITVCLQIRSGQLPAQESSGQLARKAQNPIANIMSFPFQNNTTFRIGSYERTQNVLNIQPVIPFMGGRLITRTIFPIVWQPELATETGISTGVGDLQFTAIMARSTGAVTWGLGPMLTMPTGGQNRGTEKWSVGPSFIILAMPGPWVLGGLVNYSRSFDGKQNRADVSQLLMQPFVNYNIGENGWYLASSPIVTADLKAPSGYRWLVPMGSGLGKVSRLGAKGLPVNAQVGAFYNVARPDWGPRWSTRVQIQLLIPKAVFGGQPTSPR
jgi:hypothetical protein